MNDDELRALLRAAERIADGDRVEWSEGRGESPLDSRLRQLSRLQHVAGAYRKLHESPLPDDGGEALEARAAGTALFRWGPLDVLQKLGEGTSGEVYRAWDPVLHREVALKLRRAAPEGASARRGLDEARRLARVRHPNVLTVHGADVHDGRAGLWTDLLRGITLEDWLAERGPMSAHEAAAIGLDLSRALAAVHAAGLVHGDVKAGNVMRERGGRIVLMDFGAVRERESAMVPTTTPLCAAPEVLRGQPATPASDLYSLGVLLYRLVSGAWPVTGRTLEELLEKHWRGARVPLRDARPDLPAGFVRVVERALAAEPGQRFASAGAMEAALAEAGGAAAPAAARATAPGRRRALVAAVAVVLVALAVLAAPRLRRTAPPPAEPRPAAVGAPSGAPGVAAPSAPTAADRATAPAPSRQPQPAPVAVASLYRNTAGGREPLATGSRVGPGDRLFMEVESPEPLYFYVLNEDDRGSVFVLFPVMGVDLANPLGGAGGRHRLPGVRDGAPLDWQVTSAGGRETILAIASRRPLPLLEERIGQLSRSELGRPVEYPELSAGELADLRGIGGMVTGPPQAAAGGRLQELARELSRAGVKGGIWTRSIELFNPVP